VRFFSLTSDLSVSARPRVAPAAGRKTAPERLVALVRPALAPVKPPLFVELDGTLIRTNVLNESICGLLSTQPRLIFKALASLLRGRAHFKETIASIWTPDPRTLPYDAQLLAYLSAEKAGGRRIYLVTDANHRVARQIAEHLQLFDDMIASDVVRDLDDERKLSEIIAKSGSSGFSYAGNNPAALRIWRSAATAVLANAPDSLNRRAQKLCEVERVTAREAVGLQTYVRAVRAHQWVKNLLVFLPILPLVTRISAAQLLAVTLGCIAFCLCSSFVYLVNDLMDLQFDRVHITKRERPFAAGKISIARGAALAAALVGAGLALATAISPQFLAVVALYLLGTAAYSFGAKRLVLVDVVILAGLYTLRVLGGAQAAHTPLSFWILAFSMSLFVSLAFVKRYAELRAARDRAQESTGRGYRSSDLEIVEMFGVGAGLSSVLVLGLYVDQSSAQLAFRHSGLLGLLCPLLLYWIFRVWLHAHRGTMNEDPTVFAIRDRVSRYVMVLGALIVGAAVI